MVTLHVTRELARALKLPARLEVAADAGQTVLGPWSLGLVHCRRAKLVVAVSVSTRWAFAMSAAPLAGLWQRFVPTLMLNLLALGVPPDRARREADAHGATSNTPPDTAHWALGHDRGTLAHLNQCVDEALWASNDGYSLASVNHRLAERIIIKPRSGAPAAQVLTLLGGNPETLLAGKRRVGQAWSENYHAMQLQAGAPSVTLPVQRLLGVEHLEARHQAEMLLHRLPIDEARRLPSGLPPRWVPQELVLDLTNIESASPHFAQGLVDEAARLGLRRLVLANASPGVADFLLLKM